MSIRAVDFSAVHADVESSYAAGYFDGDGCVYISKRRDSRTPSGLAYGLKVQFSQTRSEGLSRLAKRWGGTVFDSCQYWCWGLTGVRAVQFLQDIYPYSCEKSMQVWLGLEYHAQCHSRHPGRWYPLTEEELALREGFYRALQQAKRREEQ